LNKSIHIISFSIPSPANYGGAIDVFYKIKAFKSKGFDIILHCFKYDREPAIELRIYCKEVYYYPRKMVGSHLLGFHPFIVSSRKSEILITNLLKDDYPILFEGLHTCYSIGDNRLKDRLKIVRSHNLEHDYYSALANVERKQIKRMYFKSESKKLKRFEELAYKKANYVLGISQKDTKYLNDKYQNSILVSAFHAFEKVIIPTQTEPFAFYHGNLSVGENNEAALFLADKVFRGLSHKLVIAGNQPSKELKSIVKELDNIDLYDNLNSIEINERLHKARINVLPTFQSTGIKLKLLAALYNGGHCLVNKRMVDGTGLESIIHMANSVKEFKEKIESLMNSVINSEEKLKREVALKDFSNIKNIEEIINLISSGTIS
jgi:hypothetical protein